MVENDCEILCLQKDDFLKIFFNEFKEIGSEIFKAALVKRAKIKEALDKASYYIQRYERKVSRLSTIVPNRLSERDFYEFINIKNNEVESNPDSNEDENQDNSGDSQKSIPELNEPNENIKKPDLSKDETKNHSPLIKLQLLNISPAVSDSSAKKAQNFEKKLEFNDKMEKFESKLKKLEDMVEDFMDIYENSDSVNQISNTENKLEGDHEEFKIDVLHDNGISNSLKLSPMSMKRHKLGQMNLKASHFSKNK